MSFVLQKARESEDLGGAQLKLRAYELLLITTNNIGGFFADADDVEEGEMAALDFPTQAMSTYFHEPVWSKAKRGVEVFTQLRRQGHSLSASLTLETTPLWCFEGVCGDEDIKLCENPYDYGVRRLAAMGQSTLETICTQELHRSSDDGDDNGVDSDLLIT